MAADATAAGTVAAGTAEPDLGKSQNLTKSGGLVLLLVLAIAFPLVFNNPGVSNYGVFAMIYATAAVGWHIFSGNTGYIALGQAVFFGSGAYAVGVVAHEENFSANATFALLPLGLVVGAVIAVPFGLIALRVRRHTFIVITIAIFFIFQTMASNFSFTGGSSGIGAPFLSWTQQMVNQNFYYIGLACLLLSILVAWLIGRSRFGLQLRAIRDDEDRARGLGVKTMKVKLVAFVISGAITGLIGGVWFYYLGQVEPSTGYNPLFDLTLVLMIFFGGFGSISGSVLGAVIIETLSQWMNTQPEFAGSLSEVVLGAILLVIIIFMPRGILPTGAEFLTKIRSKGRPAVVPMTTIATSASAPSSSSVSSGGTR